MRIICFACLKTTGPLHIGAGRGEDASLDQPVIRNLSGLPFIPGGTLAGAFTSFLGEDADTKLKWLSTPSDTDTQPSPLVMDDAIPIEGQQDLLRWPVEVRDGNTLHRRSLTVMENHHFQKEVLPVGTLFCFSCRIDLDEETECNKFIDQMGRFLKNGGQLGGNKNAGSGYWGSDGIRLVTLDLSDSKGLTKWLTKGHGYNWQGNWDALTSDFEGFIKMPVDIGKQKDAVWQVTLKAEIKGLHMSAGATGLPRKKFPDRAQATRYAFVFDEIKKTYRLESQYVDYGDSIKGRFRTAMEMLLRTYLRKAKNPDDILKLVPEDPTKESTNDKIKDFFGHKRVKGGWAVKESSWDPESGGQPLSPDDLFKQHHNRLCEVTQHVISGAKFEFAPLGRGISEVVVTLPASAPSWQKELVYRTAHLLALNALPWGGYGSRGYLGATLSIIDGQDGTGELKGFVKQARGEAQR